MRMFEFEDMEIFGFIALRQNLRIFEFIAVIGTLGLNNRIYSMNIMEL